jgi:hypothetical protein
MNFLVYDFSNEILDRRSIGCIPRNTNAPLNTAGMSRGSNLNPCWNKNWRNSKTIIALIKYFP